MEVKNLPENVLRNIIEFKLGEPEYIKLKHSKGLREIQNKYRIDKDYNDYWIKRKEHQTTFTLHIMREPCRLYIELTGVLVNDDGYGLGKYISNDIETGFSIDEIEDGLYKSAIDLVELLDENDFYDDDYDDYEEIGIQAFIIKLILDK